MGDKKDYVADSLTESQKWLISFVAAVLFVVIASPFMFKLTGKLSLLAGVKTEDGGLPNMFGLILHAIVFAVVIRLSMFLRVPEINS